MGLRDQLLKAGLVSKKDARKAESSKRKEDHEAKKNRELAEKLAAERAAEQAAIDAEKAAKIERDRQLNLERDAEAREREKIHRVRQMLESNRIYELTAELPYYFLGENQWVCRLMVTHFQREMLARGKIGIARYHGSGDQEYVLVPRHTIASVRSVLPDHYVVLHDPIEDSVELTEEVLNNGPSSEVGADV